MGEAMPDWERKYIGRWKMPNDDYIKRSDLVARFSNFDPGWSLIDQREVLDDIQDFPAADVEPKRKWISVDEEEPEKDGEYFVLHSVFGRPVIEVMNYGTPSFFEEMRCFYRYDSEWGDIVVNDVSHWLPLSALPEPPKGENNAKQ